MVKYDFDLTLSDLDKYMQIPALKNFRDCYIYHSGKNITGQTQFIARKDPFELTAFIWAQVHGRDRRFAIQWPPPGQYRL